MTTTTAATGPAGFYVSIQRGAQYGLLLGPCATREEAEALEWRGRDLAPQVDGRAAFDGYGITRVQVKAGQQLPEGKLNGLLADTIREERTWPTGAAAAYLDRLRNPAKADHAQAVWEALCLDQPLPPRPAGLAAKAAGEVESRVADLVAAKRDPRPCAARFGPSAVYPEGGTCGRPGSEHHGWRGHAYQAPEET